MILWTSGAESATTSYLVHFLPGPLPVWDISCLSHFLFGPLPVGVLVIYACFWGLYFLVFIVVIYRYFTFCSYFTAQTHLIIFVFTCTTNRILTPFTVSIFSVSFAFCRFSSYLLLHFGRICDANVRLLCVSCLCHLSAVFWII